MRAAIIGYGKMGHVIERVLVQRGHSVGLIIDVNNQDDLCGEKLKDIDVAIEFTTPATAYNNVKCCINSGVAVVSGTTGWNDKVDELKELCRAVDGTFFYSSNYSIGVNILFSVNRYLASVVASYPQYSAHIEETHHIHKLDSPSGTAVSLANDMGREGMKVESIESFREGEVAGIHKIIYDCNDDTIVLSHSAKSRNGLAVGAVMAAEYAASHKGVLGMNDMLNLKY